MLAAARPNQIRKKAGMAISAIVSSNPRTIQCHHSGENMLLPPWAGRDGGRVRAECAQVASDGPGVRAD
jgi:hypothetical protein